MKTLRISFFPLILAALAGLAAMPAGAADVLLEMELESQSRDYSNQTVPYGPVKKATWTVPGPGLIRIASWQSVYFADTGISSSIETFNVPGATSVYAWPGRNVESASSPSPRVKGQPYLTVSIIRIDRRMENLGVNLGPPFQSNSYRPGGYQYAAKKILRIEFIPGDSPSWPGGIFSGLQDLMTEGSPQSAAPSGPPPPVGNIALGKPASQSSTSPWSKTKDAQGAVDGVKNGSFGFHTAEETNPWWQVDLGSTHVLGEIRVFNRLDYNPERVRTLQAQLSLDGMNWKTVYRHASGAFGGNDGKPLRIMLKSENARFVRLILAEKTWFHLDEVEVYPLAGPAPAPGGSSSGGSTPGSEPPSPPGTTGVRKIPVTFDMLEASSIYNGYTPIKAFDGDLGQNTGWCASGGQKTAWLSVDFKSLKRISSVRLMPDRYKTEDRTNSYLSAFRVEVWEQDTWKPVSDLMITSVEEWYQVSIGKDVRKLRFWCESTGNGPQIKEIEIFGE